MAGFILLAGGAEFGGKMALPDKKAIELAGGSNAPISIIPTAAAPDNNHKRAGNNGVNWFRGLGATNPESMPLIDKSSANDPAIAEKLRNSRLIYLLGGFTGYLGETLKDSLCWQACLEAYQSGAVIAGSSAGAMVFCQYYYDPSQSKVVDGLNLVPNSLVLPHHNNFGKRWANQLAQTLPDVVLLGIDEFTAMLDNGDKTTWQVLGGGEVVLYKKGKPTAHPTNTSFSDSFTKA
jgi:cyanophycinase